MFLSFVSNLHKDGAAGNYFYKHPMKGAKSAVRHFASLLVQELKFCTRTISRIADSDSIKCRYRRDDNKRGNRLLAPSETIPRWKVLRNKEK